MLAPAMNTTIHINTTGQEKETPQKLLQNPTLPRFLAAQLLFNKPAVINLDPASTISSSTTTTAVKLAWTIVNLRHTFTALHISVVQLQQQPNPYDPTPPPDLPASLCGLITYVIDLIWYTIRDLDSASKYFRTAGNDPERQHQILTHLMTSPTCFTLPLLLTNLPRIFLRSTTRYLRSIGAAGAARLSNPNPNLAPDPTTQSWLPLLTLLSSTPISLLRFEALLAELDHHIKRVYDEAGWDETARARYEAEMLCKGTVGFVLVPVVQRLLGSALDKVVEGAGDLNAWTPGTGRGLWEPVPVPVMDKEGTGLWDVTKKEPLFGLKEWKRCNTCGSVTENLTSNRAGGRNVLWVSQLSRSCVCGGLWSLVGE